MNKTALAAALTACFTLPAPVLAQGPGFLFNSPRLSVGVRAGYQLPRVGSDIFDFPLEELTLSRSDFASPYWGGELAVRVADQWDVAVGIGWARSRRASEYVDWVDQDDNPIEQVTTFETISGTLGAKYYFGERGRTIGRFAWVPTRFTPYVGGGIGVVTYELDQVGDWVDFETLEIFSDRTRTDGTGVAGYLAGGAELALSKRFVLSGEARYTLASAPVTGPYSSFDRIDLAGLQLLAGMAVRF